MMRRHAGALAAALAFALSACGAAQPTATAGAKPTPAGPLAHGRCNTQNLWSTTAWPLSKVAAGALLHEAERHGAALPADRSGLTKAMRGAVFWWMIRSMTVEGLRHNAAALPLRGHTTADGRPLWIVRSAYTHAPAAEGSCFHALVHRGGVRHVLNLYDGEMHTADLDAAERTTVQTAGGTWVHAKSHDGGWRGAMRTAWKAWKRPKSPADKARPEAERRAVYEAARAKANEAVAALIREHLLRPGGAAPKGHVHVHCGGGMHRTGMVVGVMDRCINGAPMSRVSADYKRHVGWRSAETPGGHEAQNLDFIARFPCKLLSI